MSKKDTGSLLAYHIASFMYEDVSQDTSAKRDHHLSGLIMARP